SIVGGAWNPGISFDKISATSAVPPFRKSIDGPHSVFFGDDSGDEARLGDWTVDSYASDEARSDLAARGDVGSPPQGGVDVVAHLACTGHTIRDHERPGEIRERLHERVHVHVPQAGYEKLSSTIDHGRIGGNRCRGRGTSVGDPVPRYQYCVIRMDRAARDVDHRNVGDRDCVLGSGSGASRPRQQRKGNRPANYLVVRFTRQVPVCGVFVCDPRVTNVPSIVSPSTLPVNVVTTGQSHWGSR